jgi:hypothetical protein
MPAEQFPAQKNLNTTAGRTGVLLSSPNSYENHRKTRDSTRDNTIDVVMGK